MNRYITVLLVVLAATGVEAQKYESALKLAMTDMSYQEVLQQSEALALEHDILSVIKALKQASEKEFNKKTYPAGHAILFRPLEFSIHQQNNTNKFPFIENTHQRDIINTRFIRGPTA
jgi:hypothetical protein